MFCIIVGDLYPEAGKDYY